MYLFHRPIGKPLERTEKNVADAMLVNEKIRFADMDGDSHSISDHQITGFRTEDSCSIVIRREGGETVELKNIKFCKYTESHYYISGEDAVYREVGDIVRVREESL